MFELRAIRTVVAAFLIVCAACGREPARERSQPDAPITVATAITVGGVELYRPVAGVATSSGLWLLDAGNQRLLLIRGDSVVRTLGRKGEGPGEFQVPVRFTQDTSGRLVVWDRPLGRMTWFVPGRGADSVETLTSPILGMRIAAALPGAAGSIVLLGQSLSAEAALHELPEGALGVLGRLGADGQLDSISTVPPWGPVVVRYRSGRSYGIRVWIRPYSAEPYLDATPACGGIVAISSGGRDLRIEFFNTEGRRLGELTSTTSRVEVTSEEREAIWALFRESDVPLRELQELIPMPELHPAVNDLRLTTNGQLWLRLTPRRIKPEPTQWRVWPIKSVTPSSIVLGSPSDVRFPDPVTVYDTRADTVFGVTLSPLNEELLATYLVRPELDQGCARS